MTEARAPSSKKRPAATRAWSAWEAGHAFSWSRFLMLLALLLMQLLSLLGVLWVSRTDSERALRLQTQTALKQLVRVASDNTRSYLLAAASMVQISHSLLASRDLDDQSLQPNLSATVNAVPQIDGAMVGESNGDFVFVRRDGQARFIRNVRVRPVRRVTDEYWSASGQLLRREVSQAPFDPATRPWFVQAVRAHGKPVWTQPYIFASSRRPGITVAATLPGRVPSTVVAMDVQLRGLTTFLQSVQFSPEGRAFIADGAGHAVAASRAWPISVQDRIPTLREVGDPPLQTLLGTGDLNEVLAGRTEVVRQFTVDGQRYGAALRRFEVQPGMNWLIGVYAPESDFTDELRRLNRQQLWVILGVLLLSGAVAWPLAFQATRPLSSLHRQATTDALTGLLNRATFLAQLRSALASDAPGELGVVLLDLDGFKAINDTFGHSLGDEVLSEMGQRLRALVRGGDVLGRLGGDEFALLVRGATREVVKLRVEGTLQELQRRRVQSGGIEHPLGGTAGLAFRENEADNSAEELLARADKALLRGKRQGKGRVWISGDSGSTLLD